MPKPTQQYLGDGVYASHDGYQIWLAVNHHENKVIAIDPTVFRALMVYAASEVWDASSVAHELRAVADTVEGINDD